MANEDTSAPRSEPNSHAAFTRRSVVRAGAHAAWVVPAVSIAAAAPAFAVSEPPSSTTQGVAPSR